MRERTIERKLRQHVEKRGGMALKFVSSVAGVPDRVIILAGDVFFVETKATNGRVSKRQKATIAKMRRAGAEVHVIKSVNGIKDIIP